MEKQDISTSENAFSIEIMPRCGDVKYRAAFLVMCCLNTHSRPNVGATKAAPARTRVLPRRTRMAEVCNPPGSVHGFSTGTYSVVDDVSADDATRLKPLKYLTSDICPREETVSKLADLIAEKTVVHVRGTPSSGKTVLAWRLEKYYEARSERCALIIGWRGECDPVEKCINHYSTNQNTGAARASLTFMITTSVISSTRRKSLIPTISSG
jgi:hypothetical protein